MSSRFTAMMFLAGLLSTRRTMSPFLMPARSAGLPGSTARMVITFVEAIKRAPNQSDFRRFRSEQFAERFGDALDRNCKTDALAFAVDRHVEADQFAFEIHERTAAVAGIDRGVGLNPIFISIGSSVTWRCGVFWS